MCLCVCMHVCMTRLVKVSLCVFVCVCLCMYDMTEWEGCVSVVYAQGDLVCLCVCVYACMYVCMYGHD